MAHPAFIIERTKFGEFRFRLTAKNGQVILSSESYTTKDGCKNGIESVRKNAPNDDRYERKEAKNGQPFFNLRAGNNQVIGTSELYSSASGMNTGIESVKRNAPIADIEDTTVRELAPRPEPLKVGDTVLVRATVVAVDSTDKDYPITVRLEDGHEFDPAASDIKPDRK